MATPRSEKPRYYIGEWFGHNFASLTPEQRREWAAKRPENPICPFRSALSPAKPALCNKVSGVCSLRHYSRDAQGTVVALDKRDTVCPNRFAEDRLVFNWVGEHLLADANPIIVPEVPFLSPTLKNNGRRGAKAVGKIDHILVSQRSGTLDWCALEMQAVYFSGENLKRDLDKQMVADGSGLHWPVVRRAPDYRSSGPKRLMPQLQTKVPTIRVWGKKTAVVVDEAFWAELGQMRKVEDLSNAEVIWFVVRYIANVDGTVRLARGDVHYTKLDDAVIGLTGGTPMSKERFESELRTRFQPLEAR